MESKCKQIKLTIRHVNGISIYAMYLHVEMILERVILGKKSLTMKASDE